MKKVISGFAVMAAILVCFAPFGSAYGAGRNDESIRFTFMVRSSPKASYETKREIARTDWAREWYAALAKERKADIVPALDVYVDVSVDGKSASYVMSNDGVLYNPHQQTVIELPPYIRSEWKQLADDLRSKHYGEMLRWEKAKARVPMKHIVTVVDLETGLSFRAQRRAGSHHADVQPLTKEDTSVMKQIYGGKWSWKRRVILVLAGGKPIAASMHGMPHGGDGIPDNAFSGHFCIHFQGSMTHRSGHPDFAHQLMVRKAAGKLIDYRSEASPIELAGALMEALHRQDEFLLRLALEGSPQDIYDKFHGRLGTLDSVGYDMGKQKLYPDYSESLIAEFSMKARLQGRGGGMRLETFRFVMARDSYVSPWVIQAVEGGK